VTPLVFLILIIASSYPLFLFFDYSKKALNDNFLQFLHIFDFTLEHIFSHMRRNKVISATFTFFKNYVNDISVKLKNSNEISVKLKNSNDISVKLKNSNDISVKLKNVNEIKKCQMTYLLN
jgi:hypothetical protein